jgi:hypothetical protein
MVLDILVVTVNPIACAAITQKTVMHRMDGITRLKKGLTHALIIYAKPVRKSNKNIKIVRVHQAVANAK